MSSRCYAVILSILVLALTVEVGTAAGAGRKVHIPTSKLQEAQTQREEIMAKGRPTNAGAGEEEGKNVLTYAGLGGYTGVGDSGHPFGGVGAGVGAAGDMGGLGGLGGLGAANGGLAGLGGNTELGGLGGGGLGGLGGGIRGAGAP